jgi:hypothetical protein
VRADVRRLHPVRRRWRVRGSPLLLRRRRPATFRLHSWACSGFPELVTVGLSIEMSARALNDVARRVMDGQNLIPGALLSFEDWPHSMVPEVLPNPGKILRTANRY